MSTNNLLIIVLTRTTNYHTGGIGQDITNIV